MPGEGMARARSIRSSTSGSTGPSRSKRNSKSFDEVSGIATCSWLTTALALFVGATTIAARDFQREKNSAALEGGRVVAKLFATHSLYSKGWLFDMINHKKAGWTLRRYQLEPELLLNRGKDGRTREVGSCRWVGRQLSRFRSPSKINGVAPFEVCSINYGACQGDSRLAPLTSRYSLACPLSHSPHPVYSLP